MANRIERIELWHVNVPLPAPFWPSWIPGYPQTHVAQTFARFFSSDGLIGETGGPAFTTERRGFGDLLGGFLLGMHADAGRTPRCDDVGTTPQAGVTPGILPSALRASLRLFQIAPGDLVGIDIDQSTGLPIGTAAGCRAAVGDRDVPDETCAACGGAVRIIACIEDAEVIEKILTHLDKKTAEPKGSWRPPCRAPP